MLSTMLLVIGIVADRIARDVIAAGGGGGGLLAVRVLSTISNSTGIVATRPRVSGRGGATFTVGVGTTSTVIASRNADGVMPEPLPHGAVRLRFFVRFAPIHPV